jgi:hypothetical protein
VAQLFSLGHMSTLLSLRVRRFIMVAGCVTLALIGLFVLICSFPDSDLPPYPHETLFQKVSTFVCLVGSWPLVVATLISHSHGDQPLLWFPLWIVSGLFWAFMLELFIIVKSRLWPNKSPEPTAVTPSVPHSRADVSSRRWLSFFR